MLDAKLQMLKDLTDADAPSGFEKEAKDVMAKYITPLADEILTDNLGSIIAKKNGSTEGPNIMIAGHLDEIGFMVTKIDDNGFIKFQTLGGWWSQVMLSQRVTITTRKGEKIIGVTGSTPPHILSPEARKKPVEIDKIFIDVGVASKDEVLELGIRPGDMITPYFEFTQMGNDKYLLAKAWDNRIGCAIAIDVLDLLQEENHPNTVFGVGTTQEEVGLRGARTSSHVVKPDIAISLDVGIAGDTPGIDKNLADAKLGAGPLITLFDRSMIGHAGLRDFVVGVAEELEIPFQYVSLSGGGTDAGAMHVAYDGAPGIAIGIATRYIHSHSGILHRDDYENAVKLIAEVCKRLDNDAYKKIVFGE
jgi:endoglucanase